jgi:hypothetical protein
MRRLPIPAAQLTSQFALISRVGTFCLGQEQEQHVLLPLSEPLLQRRMIIYEKMFEDMTNDSGNKFINIFTSAELHEEARVDWKQPTTKAKATTCLMVQHPQPILFRTRCWF